jgi:hypothetical protein
LQNGRTSRFVGHLAVWLHNAHDHTDAPALAIDSIR